MLSGTYYINRPHMSDVVEDFSWRDVPSNPRKARSSPKLKLTLGLEMSRKPRHRGSKVVAYRLKEVK